MSMWMRAKLLWRSKRSAGSAPEASLASFRAELERLEGKVNSFRAARARAIAREEICRSDARLFLDEITLLEKNLEVDPEDQTLISLRAEAQKNALEKGLELERLEGHSSSLEKAWKEITANLAYLRQKGAELEDRFLAAKASGDIHSAASGLNQADGRPTVEVLLEAVRNLEAKSAAAEELAPADYKWKSME